MLGTSPGFPADAALADASGFPGNRTAKAVSLFLSHMKLLCFPPDQEGDNCGGSVLQRVNAAPQRLKSKAGGQAAPSDRRLGLVPGPWGGFQEGPAVIAATGGAAAPAGERGGLLLQVAKTRPPSPRLTPTQATAVTVPSGASCDAVGTTEGGGRSEVTSCPLWAWPKPGAPAHTCRCEVRLRSWLFGDHLGAGDFKI